MNLPPIHPHGIQNLNRDTIGRDFLLDLKNHPKCSTFSESDWSMISTAIYLAKTIHRNDKRHDERPYIVHPLEVTENLIAHQDKLTVTDICVALLHDTLEDHPAYWRILYHRMGIDIFR